jgi:hypothetical protein
VSIVPPQGDVVVGDPAEFMVDNQTLSDDRDSPSELVIEWAVFDNVNAGCQWITKADWATSTMRLDRFAPYEWSPPDSDVACVCVRATDRDGAWSFLCERVTPIKPEPVAKITDEAGIASGTSRALCSKVRLSAEQASRFVKTDQLTFDWGIRYEGSDANGKNIQLGDCDDVVTSLPAAHRCFYAAVPGLYTVTLTITNDGKLSNQDAFLVNVASDTPPSLQRTEPDVHAQTIMLGPTETRTLKVYSVADDCEPYPVPAGSSKQPTHFVWSISIYDPTQSSPKWVYQTNTTDSFTISQSMFPSVLCGDTIKVRVEVRDAAVEQQYLSGVSACDERIDICCGASACTGVGDRIRWTTWTVFFVPCGQ